MPAVTEDSILIRPIWEESVELIPQEISTGQLSWPGKKKIHAGTKRTLNKFSPAFENKEEKRQPLVTSVYQHAMHRVLQVHQAVPKQCTHMHTNTQHP